MKFTSVLSIAALAFSVSAMPTANAEPSVISCWSTCSTDCEKAGNIRGGLCSTTGTCTCLLGAKEKREAMPEPLPETVVQCWSTCSTNCDEAGFYRGGLCSSTGVCTCLQGI